MRNQLATLKPRPKQSEGKKCSLGSVPQVGSKHAQPISKTQKKKKKKKKKKKAEDKKKEAEDLEIAKSKLQSLSGELQQDPRLLEEFQRLRALHSAKQADLAARAPEQSPVPGEPSRRSSRIRKPKPIHDV